MRFTINLATRTHLDHHFLNRILFLVIALLLSMVVWNGMRLVSNRGEQSRLHAEIAAIQGKLGVKPSGISETDVIRQKGQIRLYNEIIDRKSKNWLNLLEIFENVTPEGVALSSLTPGSKPDEWKLDGNARSFKAVQQYLEKLETTKSFSNILLQSHQNISAGVNVHGVRFSISCKVVN